MTTQKPIISLVIPLFNKERTVQRALDSVMRQTILPLEIIVVDDGSTDGSRDVVEQSRNPLVTLISQENAGVSDARNSGIREARGEWIAFLDADDEWEPGYLEQINRLILQFPTCIGAATAYYLGDAQGNKKKIMLRNLPFITESGVLSNYFQVAVHSDPPVWTSAVCIRKDWLLKTGGFLPRIQSGEDLFTWAHLAVSSNFSYCIKPLATFWREVGNTNKNPSPRIPEQKDIVGNMLLSLHKEYRGSQKKWFRYYIGLWHKMRAHSFIDLNMKKEALIEILKSIFYNPFSKIWIFLPILIIPGKYLNTVLNHYYRNS